LWVVLCFELMKGMYADQLDVMLCLVASSAVTNTSAGGEEETLVSQLFEGVLTSETRCLTCESVIHSSVFHFLCLS
jgi:hypothetical protein